jgi:hypothetical protein
MYPAARYTRGSNMLAQTRTEGVTVKKETEQKTLYEGAPVVHVKQLFDPTTHQAIIEFLDTRGPMIPMDVDNQTFFRTQAHNVPFFVAIHHQLTDVASEILGEKVKPSYVFLSRYTDQGICPLHMDRHQCRYTLDYLIRQSSDKPWPIYVSDQMSDEERLALDDIPGAGHPQTDEEIGGVKGAQTWHQVDMEPNDAVALSGSHSWHYRDRIPEGTADLLFFHFVPESYNGSLD